MSARVPDCDSTTCLLQDLLDEDGSGKVDMNEYIEWSLKDALLRSSSRVIDLFRAWDEDKNGTVDKKEFYKAIKSLGFEVAQEITDSVFDSLDDDNSGALEYKELQAVRAGRAAPYTWRAPVVLSGAHEDPV